MSTEDKLSKTYRAKFNTLKNVMSKPGGLLLRKEDLKFLTDLVDELAPEPKQPEPVVLWAAVDKEGVASPADVSYNKEGAEKICKEYNSWSDWDRNPYRVVKLVEQPE